MNIAGSVDTITDHVLDRTCELAAIPAPPLQESDRSAVVADWWDVADRLGQVQIDDVGNVWARVRTGSEPSVAVCGHLDTVFSAEVDHTPYRDGDRLRGPSVGDDSVAVAALSTLDRTLPPTTSTAVWLLATVGEEGQGDLAGARHALSAAPTAIGTMVAIEGNWLGRVGVVGVGSLRFRVEWHGPGGHAWECSTAPNALHCASRAVASLDELPAHYESKVGVNVGLMSGGEAINSRASSASFLLDLRAENQEQLVGLERRAREICARSAQSGVEVEVTEIGRRPAGGIAEDHALVQASIEALRQVAVDPSLVSGSTDANAAYAAGVPAVTLGITNGSGEHTESEWIAIPPIPKGITALGSTVAVVAGAESA